MPPAETSGTLLLGIGHGLGPAHGRRGQPPDPALGPRGGQRLDLSGLLQAKREVHLADLDREALARGVARQDFTGDPVVRRRGDLDLADMLEAIATRSPRTPIRPSVPNR
jgi:hypothetical protein